ncbi:hypothetical protein VT84_34145 [Gemmata sp. SH-PL17]|uniref:TIGR03067 domain-containing protein n=1 Tax=Gemmata sp. SH-PL17 TaxID=1630693 RepID=UPI0004AEC7A7|nr:TIGR03067 domain-containing protein [Gemmata sp. SH-PL17]AMV29486.1 hypothetical protein VT84_34145 [Gemmata sp. SH-PL17]
MKVLAAIVLSALVAAPVPPAPPVDPLKAAQQGFQGPWKVVAHIEEGEPWDKEQAESAKLTVKDNVMSISTDGKNLAFAFTLDPKSEPCGIDLVYQLENEPGKTVKGIYKLEKDKLTICFATDGERPKEFHSAVNSRTGVLILERVKK